MTDPRESPKPDDAPAKCPWCGVSNVLIEQSDPNNAAGMYGYEYRVWCPGVGWTLCGAHGPRKPSKDEAIAAWNRVALAPARLAEATEALRGLVEAAQQMVRNDVELLSFPKIDAYGEKPLKEDIEAPIWSEAALYGRFGKDAARTLLGRVERLESALSAARRVVGGAR